MLIMRPISGMRNGARNAVFRLQPTRDEASQSAET
jgi:hypothetical protein